MRKHAYLSICFLMLIAVSCKNETAVISDNVEIEIFTYQTDGKTKASAMPKIRSNSKLNEYSRRYDYLLINLSKIHTPQKSKEKGKSLVLISRYNKT